MAITVLVVGNDLHVHKLVVDILEITFSDVTLEKATNTQAMLKKIETQQYSYDLLVLDLQNSKKEDEVLVLNLRNKYPHLASRMILLLDSIEEKPDDTILQGIPFVVKPFSLDAFGELVKQVCSENN